MKLKTIWLAAAVFGVLLAAGCQKAGTEAMQNEETIVSAMTSAKASTADIAADMSDSIEFFALDTYIALRAYGENCTEALEAARAEIERLDAMMSTGNENSEIAGLNRDGEGTLSPEPFSLLMESLKLAKETDGAFDIAIYPVMEAWGFAGEEKRVPGDDELAELLPLCDVSLIDYDEKTRFVSFREPGVKIDFGGIAKGYISSLVADIFREYGLESGYVDLGGNIQILGAKTDGELWRIGIVHPEDPSKAIGVVLVRDEAVITSGGYERYFEENGTRYHHIIDPSTGKPADNGLVSVTIVSGNGMLADGLSTSLYIMGTERAIAFCSEHVGEFDAVLMDGEGIIYVTEGIADRFVSESEFEIIGEAAKT